MGFMVHLWEGAGDWSSDKVRERLLDRVATAPLGEGRELSVDDGAHWKPLPADRGASALARRNAIVTFRGPYGEVALTRRARRSGVFAMWSDSGHTAAGAGPVAAFVEGMVGALPDFRWGVGSNWDEVSKWAFQARLPPLPECLAEYPRWLHVVAPAALAEERVDPAKLDTAPVHLARRLARGERWIELYADPFGADTEERRARLAAFVRHLTG